MTVIVNGLYSSQAVAWAKSLSVSGMQKHPLLSRSAAKLLSPDFLSMDDNGLLSYVRLAPHRKAMHLYGFVRKPDIQQLSQ